MKSSASTVDEFLTEHPEHIRKELVRLRAMVRGEAPHAGESMKYGGPVYTDEGGRILCGFMAQKNNLAFYVGRVPEDFRDRMKAAGFNLGKGAIRFKRLDEKKLDALRSLLRVVVERKITCD